MKTEALIKQDWDDLVFENRNQDYGAFVLRKSYSGSVVEAAGASIALAVFIFFLPAILSNFSTHEVVVPVSPILPPILLREPTIEIIPAKPVQQQRQKSLDRYVAPVVTRQLVDEVDITPPTADPVEGSKDGTETQVPIEGNSILPSDPGPVIEAPVVDEIRTIVEFMPEYNGGLKAMSRFISDRVKYPRSAKITGLEGKVYVQFVIAKDGSVTDVQVVRGVSADIDREAARVIALMPKWKPGRQGNSNVRVKMVLPVNFTMEHN